MYGSVSLRRLQPFSSSASACRPQLFRTGQTWPMCYLHERQCVRNVDVPSPEAARSHPSFQRSAPRSTSAQPPASGGSAEEGKRRKKREENKAFRYTGERAHGTSFAAEQGEKGTDARHVLGKSVRVGQNGKVASCPAHPQLCSVANVVQKSGLAVGRLWGTRLQGPQQGSPGRLCRPDGPTQR